jgi:hypothetical protein
MKLTPEKLAEMDYEAAQAEKRDKLNSRLQVWSLLVGLIGAFGLASIQSGLIPYVVALFPLLAACLARYVGHSEKVLDQVKAYLYAREEETGIAGYEHWNKARKRAGAGGHLRAFRDVVVLIDLLATASVAFRLIVDHWFLAAAVLVFVELIMIACTCYWLRDR